MQNDPKLDLVKFNAYLKFGETQFVQDIEQKWNLGINQGP